MFTFIVILILITASLLILATLVQNAKKDGLGSPLGNTSTSQLIGVKKTTDFLEQFTWGLVITLLVLTLTTSLFLNKTTHLPASPNIDRAQEYGTLPIATSPGSAEQPSSSTAEPEKE